MACRALRVSAMKLPSPGVSRMLILRLWYSAEANETETELLRRISSGSQSKLDDSWSTLPSRLVAPALNRSASPREVLPH